MSPATSAQLEPVMVGELYTHVLSLIESMGGAMERTPAVYRTHEEEQLRDQLLTILNTHYRGQATGETFNASGKTDILVRVDDRNVFIGECKWWGGPKAFADAIEQLYGYSTWRDTKLAVVMFVRAKGLTEIIAKAREVVADHDTFISWLDDDSESHFGARVHWPGDEHREADLAVTFIHLPS